MVVVRNARVLFNSIPTGYPEPRKATVYDDSQTIDLDNVPLRGGFLIKTLVLSIDPYMRSLMRDPSIKSYSDAYTPREPITSFGVGVVVRTETPDAKPGDHVYGTLKHEEYSIASSIYEPGLSGVGLRIIQREPSLPWSVYVGAAGMPGKTAWMAWKEFAHAKAGETAFITTGGGPVVSFVIQLAKNAGLKVIASAGSEEKVEFMKSLGTTDTREVLAKEGSIDIYWDNVGGSALEAALEYSSVYARFIECGMITGYNGGFQPVKNLMKIVANSISVNGFVVGRFESKYADQFYKEVPPKLASGEIKYMEETWRGLNKVGDAMLAVQKGENKAKVVVIVADE